MEYLKGGSAQFFYWLFHNLKPNKQKVIKKSPYHDLHITSEGIIETTSGVMHQFSLAYYSFRFGDHWRDPEISFLAHIPTGKLEGTSPVYPCCYLSDAGQVYEASITLDEGGNLKTDVKKQKRHAVTAEIFLEELQNRGYGEG